MSAKALRSRAWDDRHLTGVWSPLKPIIRAFSSVTLSVILLCLVALHGILASVPIGVIALAPTWLFYALTLLASIAMLAFAPMWLANRAMSGMGVARAVRFSVVLIAGLALTLGSIWLWTRFAWPALKYNPRSGQGVEFFASFVERYKAVQLRRLPGIEMSEMEFYAWWPLSLVLVLFVLNLVVATLRRIEFKFVNLGVLSVHTGIVTIALGSAYYATNKQEGDMLLTSGGIATSADAMPLPGKRETGFYDNTRVALWLSTNPDAGWEQRPVRGVPRYNAYNLGVVPGFEPLPEAIDDDSRDVGPLSVPIVDGLGPSPDRPGAVPSDVRFRVVGYAPYCELIEKWVPGESGVRASTNGANQTVSLREVHALLRKGDPAASVSPAATWKLIPQRPADRGVSIDLLSIDHTLGVSEARWNDLSTPLPKGARHAIIAELPGSDSPSGERPGYRGVFAIEEGATIALGDTGWTLDVRSIAPQAPFPIITKGYEGASSSVAIVGVRPPTNRADLKPFDRWCYSRFPEIAQDVLMDASSSQSEGMGGGGRPMRRDPDASIRLTYIDASRLQVYLDEKPDGSLRAISRVPGGGGGGGVSVTPSLKEGDEIVIAPMLSLKVGAKVEDVRRVEVPRIVPEVDRDKGRVGNHQAAAIALEVSEPGAPARTIWVPFTQYLGVGGGGLGGETQRTLTLKDGKVVTVAFGRVRHEFNPPMSVRMADFRMTPYPHSQTPRDYASDVIVSAGWGANTSERKTTSLNEPLLVRPPFVPNRDAPAFVNALGWLLNLVVPTQYKFSQAGWDQGGWRESEAAMQRGEAQRAFARFTILGVGNNPGIYLIATGAVVMSLGIPWAFYVKPWLVQRQKRAIQRAIAQGTFVKKPRATARTATEVPALSVHSADSGDQR